jgi:thiol reductant ABC exporter CydC subunit
MARTFRRLLRLAAPLSGSIGLAVLLGVLTVGSGIGLMATSAYLISAAALHPSVAALGVAIVGVRFFGISRGIWRYLERYVSHYVTFGLLARLRVWFYAAIEPLAPARLLAYRSGDLLTRVVSDIQTLQDFYVRVLAPPLVAALVGVGMWYFLGAFNGVFAVTLLGFYLLAGAGVPLLTHLLSRRLGQELIAVRAELNVALVDGIQGVADVVAFGQEDAHYRRVQALNRRLIAGQERMAWIGALQGALGNGLMNLALWTMLVAAIPLVRAGQLDGVYLAVLLLAALTSFEAVLPLPAAFGHLGATLEAARRLFEIVDAAPAVQDPAAPSPVPRDYRLEVHDLRFRYEPGAALALDGVSFTVPTGGCVALVGPSGAGKSTVARLLLRFWDTPEGAIRLGGHDLRSYHQDDLHRLIATVAQQTYLFNTTIGENLRLARPAATEADLVRATRQAQIYEFIAALPRGFDTPIGEQGLRLSGGERQRLALARAFLQDAPILLLDEPTAHLDTLTEQALLEPLHALMRGRTTLLITHRLVGLDMAGEILVLRQGRVVERGSHHELVQLEGLYWKMWTLQNQGLLPTHLAAPPGG